MNKTRSPLAEIATQYVTITNSQSPLNIITPKTDGVFGIWNRYLTVDNKKIFDTGVVCESCACYFQRLPGNSDRLLTIAEELSNSLNKGITQIDQNTLQKANMLMPNGDYVVLLCRIKPKVCTFEDACDYYTHEHKAYWNTYGRNDELINPHIAYYHLRKTYKNPSDNSSCLHTKYKKLFIEFLVPMKDPESLDKERITYYQQQIKNESIPTVLALAIFDQKSSQDTTEHAKDIESHQFLAHYLLDGHHKAYAASREDKEINMLTFLRLDNYFGSELSAHDVQDLINTLATKE